MYARVEYKDSLNRFGGPARIRTGDLRRSPGGCEGDFRLLQCPNQTRPRAPVTQLTPSASAWCMSLTTSALKGRDFEGEIRRFMEDSRPRQDDQSTLKVFLEELRQGELSLPSQRT